MYDHSDSYKRGLRTKALNKLKRLLEAEDLVVYSMSKTTQPQGFWLGLSDPFWDEGKFSKIIFFILDEIHEKPSPFSNESKLISRFHNDSVDILSKLIKLHMQLENEIQKKHTISAHDSLYFSTKPVFDQRESQIAFAAETALSNEALINSDVHLSPRFPITDEQDHLDAFFELRQILNSGAFENGKK